MDDDGEKRESEMERASERAAILHSLVPPNEGSGLLLTTEGRRDYDITEIDITESDVAEFDITENDITESDITETNIT